jgi:hypothetical protein
LKTWNEGQRRESAQHRWLDTPPFASLGFFTNLRYFSIFSPTVFFQSNFPILQRQHESNPER